MEDTKGLVRGVGQQDAQHSIPVVLASDQPPLAIDQTAVTGALATQATSAKQDTGNTSLASILALLALLQQPTNSVPVALSDSTDVTATATKGLWVGVGGDVTVRLASDGASRLLKNVPSGTYVPGAYSRVYSSATTATNIVSFYGP